MPSNLTDFTSEKLILSELRERTTAGVVNELNHVLHITEGLPHNLFATTAAVNYELLTSNWLDGGMVVIKARSTTLPHTRFALGRAKVGLPWRAPRLPAISFVTLVVEPAGKPVEYKCVLETLNALAHETEALKLIRESSSVEEILTILARVPFQRP